MSIDVFNALAGIEDVLIAVRDSWVKLPSGQRINLANIVAVSEEFPAYYRDGQTQVNVYGSGFNTGSGQVSYPIYGDDIPALLAAIDARTVQR